MDPKVKADLEEMYKNKEPFDPLSEDHKRRSIESFKCMYWSNKRYFMLKAGTKMTTKIAKRIRKKAIGFAHNSFNKIKKEFISK